MRKIIILSVLAFAALAANARVVTWTCRVRGAYLASVNKWVSGRPNVVVGRCYADRDGRVSFTFARRDERYGDYQLCVFTTNTVIREQIQTVAYRQSVYHNDADINDLTWNPETFYHGHSVSGNLDELKRHIENSYLNATPVRTIYPTVLLVR